MPNPFVPVALPSFSQLREAMVKATKGAGFQFQTPPPPPPVDPEGKKIPAPLEPHEEGRQRYNPYRGGEFHGVAPGKPIEQDAEGYGSGTIDVVWDETPPGGTVIDVRVISDDAEQLHAWRVNQYVAPPAGNPPVNIANRMRNRTKLQIKNMSATDGLWIGPDPELTAFNGYFIDPGDEVPLSSTEAVYALGNGPNLVPVCLMYEFTQEA